jgi:hypothetical protein
LLRVLERPDIPLHTNGSENDMTRTGAREGDPAVAKIEVKVPDIGDFRSLREASSRVSTPKQKCISDADKEALEHGRFPEASGLGWIVRRVGVVAA